MCPHALLKNGHPKESASRTGYSDSCFALWTQRLWQEDLKFKDILGYIMKFCLNKTKQKKMIIVRSQTWNKWMRCPTYQSKFWLPGSPSIPQSLPVTGFSWLAYPAPYPELIQPRGWTALPYLIYPFWLPGPFCLLSWASWLLHLVPLAPLSLVSMPLPHPHMTQGHVHWTLPDVPASDCALSINLLFHCM